MTTQDLLSKIPLKVISLKSLMGSPSTGGVMLVKEIPVNTTFNILSVKDKLDLSGAASPTLKLLVTDVISEGKNLNLMLNITTGKMYLYPVGTGWGIIDSAIKKVENVSHKNSVYSSAEGQAKKHGRKIHPASSSFDGEDLSNFCSDLS